MYREDQECLWHMTPGGRWRTSHSFRLGLSEQPTEAQHACVDASTKALCAGLREVISSRTSVINVETTFALILLHQL